MTKFTCFLLIIYTSSALHPLYAQNLILNGSFSANTANWSSFAPGSYTEATYPETTYGGTLSTNTVCEIDAESDAEQSITVTPGVAYSFSFRYTRRTSNGAAPNPSTIHIKIYDASSNYIDEDVSATNSTWSWTCYTNTFTPTGSSVTVAFSYMTGSTSTLGTLIDDVTLTPTEQDIAQTGTSCQGNDIILNAPAYPGDENADYTNYAWTGPNGFSATDASITLADLQSSDAGVYTCTMTLNSCLDLTASYTLQVSPLNATQDITACSNQLPYNWNGQMLNAPGTYTYTTQNASGCDSTVTLTFDIKNASTNTVDTVICAGQLPFVWNGITVNSSGNGAAVYTTPNAVGCDSIVTLNVVNDTTFLQVDLGPDQTICYGDSAIIESVIAPAGGGYTYQWGPAGNYMPQDGAGTIYYGDSSISLRLKVSTANGCTATDSIHINVLPEFLTTASTNDTGYCPGDSVQLSVTGGGTYRWSPAYGLSNDTIANPVAAPNVTTDYTVTITSASGCRDTQSIHVAVYPNAVISLPDSVNIYPGESYQIDPETNCLYFQWFPPSGLSATNISNPVASPEVRTRYFVTAETENGCVANDSIDVLVQGTIIDIPNAFTPGSGANNILKPVYRGIVKLSAFRIYNRWGEKVFESNDINKGWDGTFNNKPQPIGVYVYTIEAVTDSGRPFVKQGNVTLLR